jgi:hypothetical protein
MLMAFAPPSATGEHWLPSIGQAGWASSTEEISQSTGMARRPLGDVAFFVKKFLRFRAATIPAHR